MEERSAPDCRRVQLRPIQGRGSEADQARIFDPVICQRRAARLDRRPATQGQRRRRAITGLISRVGSCPRNDEYDRLEQEGARRGRARRAAVSRLLRPLAVQTYATDSADRLQLWSILARAGVDSNLLLLRHHRASSARAGLGRSRLLEGCDSPRGATSMVGTYGRVRVWPGSGDERGICGYVRLALLKYDREESEKVHHILE